MSARLKKRIAAARTAQDMHTIAADVSRLNPAERERLRPAFAARCVELWPKDCGGRKR